MRSGSSLATRTRRSSGACSNARPVSLPAPIDENSGWVRCIERPPRRGNSCWSRGSKTIGQVGSGASFVTPDRRRASSYVASSTTSMPRSPSTASSSASARRCIPLLPLPCCRAAICGWYSAHPAAARMVARPCPTAGCLRPEAGTGSSLVSDLAAAVDTLPNHGARSAMTLSSGSAASRSCSRILLVIRLNCSSRPRPKPRGHRIANATALGLTPVRGPRSVTLPG
jgi:hypothetical protein